MSQYIILLVGDDARWFETATEQEVQETFAIHHEFGEAMERNGHRILNGAALMSSKEARTIRPNSTEVTDGPFAESAEQVGGFYHVESDDLEDLLALCTMLASTGDGVEVREVLPTGGEGA